MQIKENTTNTMAKISDLKIKLLADLGLPQSEQEKEALREKYGDKEIDDDFFDDLQNKHLPAYGKNRSASIHKEYETRFERFKKRLGDDRFSQVQKRQGYDRIDALDEQLDSVLQEIEAAKRASDPEDLQAARNKLSKIEGDLANMENKYKDYVAPEKHREELEKQKKRALNSEIREYVIGRPDIDDNFKSGMGLKGITAEFYDTLAEKKLKVDFETGLLSHEDGTFLTRNNKQASMHHILEGITEAVKKKGGEAPPAVALGAASRGGANEPFLIGNLD